MCVCSALHTRHRAPLLHLTRFCADGQQAPQHKLHKTTQKHTNTRLWTPLEHYRRARALILYHARAEGSLLERARTDTVERMRSDRYSFFFTYLFIYRLHNSFKPFNYF